MTTSVFLGFGPDPSRPVGGNGVNLEVCRAVRETFPIAGDASRASLQVHAFKWKATREPRRVFIDHGAFADASFWGCTIPFMQASDTIVVGSSVCVRIAERMIDSDGPRVRHIPFGIDTRFFRPATNPPVARDDLRRAMGLPADGRLILVAAGFSRRKNHHLAVLFVRHLLEWVPDARLAIVGGVADRPSRAAYRAAVEDLAHRHGVGERVHFLGVMSRHQVRDLMQASDLLVHLSTCRIENFGLVVAEALSCGLPVVAADWGGLRDLVTPGVDGALARTYLSATGPRVDWLSAAREAAAILQDGSLLRALRDAARAKAVERFEAAVFRSRIALLLGELTREPDGRPEGVRLTPGGEDLMLRTLDLNLRHPEIRGTSEEFRRLMPLDGGKHYRLLAGPAATSESAPVIGPSDVLYPVVPFEAAGGGVRITDPAWETRFDITPEGMRILSRCDGERSLSTVLEGLGLPPSEHTGALRSAQHLVDAGLLCPLERSSAAPQVAGRAR